MNRRKGWGLVLAALCLGGTDPDRVAWGALAQDAQEGVGEAGDSAGGDGPTAVALDRALVFEEVLVGPGGVPLADESGDVAGAGESRLIYSNTLGIHATNFPTNQPVSDDIATTAPDGCRLTSFKFKVLGKVLPTGSGGPYTLTYGLYTNCPLAVGSNHAQRDLAKIPGTDGVLTFPDDGPRTVKHVVSPHNPVTIPANFYLMLRFNRSNCGTVVGAPAMVGFSADRFDFPGFPCNGFFGGFPQFPHASFWLEMYGDGECPAAFPGYKASRPSGGVATFGAGVQGVDDFQLQVEECNMTAYEVVVKGPGVYSFDIRRECDGEIIEGSERNFVVFPNVKPLLQVARFSFDPPIQLPEGELYLGFRVDANSAGAVIAGVEPAIGQSQNDYYRIGVYGCQPVIPTHGVHGAVNLTITCAGSPPMGACCDMGLLQCEGAVEPTRCGLSADCPEGTTCEAVCREVAEMNCPWPTEYSPGEPGWMEGSVCEPDPFELPCGVAACCKPDDTCENLTRNECDAAPPLDRPRLWQIGDYCAEGDQSCPFNACLAREGDCMVQHDEPGCSNPFCCTDVCTIDPWCCYVEWDRICLEYAVQYCGQAPVNDECGPAIRPYPGAIELVQSVPYYGSNFNATTRDADPGYCCNANSPGSRGAGSVWFKFVAFAETAQIDTCASDGEGDTLVAVFAEGEPGEEIGICGVPMSLIGCGDNDGCPAGTQGFESSHSRFCVEGLEIGETYFIELASKTSADQGMYEIQVKMPCQYLTPFPADDCNENGIVDGCEVADRSARDCDADGVLDECPGNSQEGPDCDQDGVADTCSAFRHRVVSEQGRSTFGLSVAYEEDSLMVGDPSLGTGVVHLFAPYGGGWYSTGVLSNPDPTATFFGRALAGERRRLLVVASDPENDDFVRGKVFAYRRELHDWVPEEFPGLADDAGSRRMVDDVIMEGDLAAVRTSCLDGPDHCDEDVLVHIYRRVQSEWRLDGTIPESGGLHRQGFDFDFGGNALAVVSNGTILVFEKTQSQWRETARRETGIQSTSISFEDTLIGLGGTITEWWSNRKVTVFTLLRKRQGIWDSGSGWLSTGFNAPGDTPQVTILSPITFAITVARPKRCSSAIVYQRTGYPCDPCYWEPLTELPLSHCGDDMWNVSLDHALSGVAIGQSSAYSPSGLAGSVQIFSIPATDCDRSGTPDLCDVHAGLLADCNHDGAPDHCQAREDGDYDLDMYTTLRDWSGLLPCFGKAKTPRCCIPLDVSGPSGIDLLDVRAFVSVMKGP